MQSISKKRAQSRRMNVIKRAKIVQEMTMKLYEPGNQSRSKAQAYRQQVNNTYPMGERTFWQLTRARRPGGLIVVNWGRRSPTLK
mgnify:CR=1 FL=1